MTDLGYELWHLELAGAGSNRLLRLYIDAEAGITLEDCEAVSHDVSVLLDVEDPITGHYQLEVSSPGLDRPLVTVEHFARFVGAMANVKLFAPIDGQRKLVGVIRGVAGDELRLECEHKTVAVPLSGIAKARLAPQD